MSPADRGHEVRLAELHDRLEAVAEELADLAIDVLREAVQSRATARPELERRLTRARAAVDKAARLLSPEPDPQD